MESECEARGELSGSVFVVFLRSGSLTTWYVSFNAGHYILLCLSV